MATAVEGSEMMRGLKTLEGRGVQGGGKEEGASGQVVAEFESQGNEGATARAVTVRCRVHGAPCMHSEARMHSDDRACILDAAVRQCAGRDGGARDGRGARAGVGPAR